MIFTADPQQLIDDFNRDGFVAIRPFIAGAELDELQANVERYIHDVVPTMPPEHVFYEDKNDPATLKQLQNMGDYDPWFGELVSSGKVRQIAELLLDGPVVAKNLQYFCKPPQTGLATPAHQDGFYFMLDPCQAITMWLALDEVDEENGCVHYVRGSHLDGMREHARTTTLGFSQGIVGYPTQDDLDRETPLPASPGDLLIHHAMTIHRAGPNESTSRTRRALGFVFFSEAAKVNAEAHAAYQRQLAEDMRAKGRI